MKLKKIISAAVGAAMLCASLPFSSATIDFVKDNVIVANAEDEMPSTGKCGDNVYYSLSDDGVLTISGTGKMYDYNFPGTMILNEKRTDSPFYCNNSIVSIVMEEGVTAVGESAFALCRSIKNVMLGSGLESIGDEAFYNCSGIDTWGLGCANIKRVGYHAFDGTSFLYHSDGEPVTLYGVLIDATDCNNGFEIPDGIISIGDGACSGRKDLIDIEIPSTIEYIGDYAFSGCTNLKEVKLPETIDEISDSLFRGCENLEKVNIPESVKSIGDSAFGGCDNLKEITIPKVVDYIGSYAFYCENLEKIEILTQTQNIHSWTFAGTKWESNKLDENSALVVNGVLLALSSDDDNYVIPDNVEKISEMCFFETEMNSIVIPNSVKKIATDAFQSAAVDHLIIPDSVTDIERYGLRCFVVRNITLSNQLTTIKEGTFYFDTELENIYIPKSITSIEEDAFGMCENLKDVYYSGTEEEWKKINIDDGNESLSNATIHFNSKEIPAEEPTTEMTTTKTETTTTTTTVTTDSKEVKLGDLNDDKNIDSKDAVLVLKSYAESLVNSNATVNLAGDINGDKKVDSKDAVIILKYYAATLTGFTGTISEFNK